MRHWRIALIAAGSALGLFGVFRLLTQVPLSSLLVLLAWMVAAVVIHDGLLSPLVVGIGTVVARVPVRARRYVQAGLVVAGLVTVIALPLIGRRDTQPAAKAILQRNYAGNLVLLLAFIAAVSMILHAVQVAWAGRKPDDIEPVGAR